MGEWCKQEYKGWEFVLGYRNRTASGLSYSITGNASHWVDIITHYLKMYGLLIREIQIIRLSDIPNFPFSDTKQWHIPEPAGGECSADTTRCRCREVQYADLNGDGKVDVNDQTWLGTTLPNVRIWDSN